MMSHFVAFDGDGSKISHRLLFWLDNLTYFRRSDCPILVLSHAMGGRVLDRKGCLYPDAAPLPHGQTPQTVVAPS